MSKKKNKVKTYSELIHKYGKSLFQTACVITGDYASAEAAVGDALFYVCSSSEYSTERGFYSAVFECVKDAAFKRIPEDAEGSDWHGFEADPEEYTDRGYEYLSEMDNADKRLLLMHYALQLKPNEIAYALEMSPSAMRARLKTLLSSLAKVSGCSVAEAEEALGGIVEYEMENPAVTPPDAGNMIRTLEMDLASIPPRRHTVRRAVRGILMAAGGILLCALILLLVILTEPF